MKSTLGRVFKAFQYRDFRLMWIGACTSSIGTWMQIVAQGWLIYRLSHSAFLLALDQFLGGIPIFLFSLIGGVVARIGSTVYDGSVRGQLEALRRRLTE